MAAIHLMVTDSGDRSVGIWDGTYKVECPFVKEDIDEGNITKQDLEWFRSRIINIYQEYATGRITAEYDFEIEAHEQWCNQQNQLNK